MINTAKIIDQLIILSSKEETPYFKFFHTEIAINRYVNVCKICNNVMSFFEGIDVSQNNKELEEVCPKCFSLYYKFHKPAKIIKHLVKGEEQNGN